MSMAVVNRDALIGLADAPANDLREEGFAYARIPDEHKIGALVQKVQVE